MVAAAWEKVKAKFTEIWNVLQPLGAFIKQTAADFYNDFLVPVASWIIGPGWDEFIRITDDLMQNSDWDGLTDSLDRFYEAASTLTISIFQGLLTFYDRFLAPIAEWTINEGLPRFLDSISEAVENIDWENVNEGWGNFLDSLTEFTLLSLDGLLTFVEDVLIPLGEWVINEALPRFFETLGNVLDILSGILEALQPLWDDFYDNTLVPLADWSADKFLDFWDYVNERLETLSDWMDENPDKVQNFFSNVLEFGTYVLVGLLAALIPVVVFFGLLAVAIFLALLPLLLLGAAMLAVITLIGVIIVNIGKLVANWEDSWNDIKQFFSDTWEFIKNKAMEKLAALMLGFALLMTWIKTKVIDPLKEWFANAWEWIKSKASDAWEGIKNTWIIVKDWFIEKVWTPLTDWCANVINSIGQFFVDAWEGIKEVWGVVKDWFMEKIWNPLLQWFEYIWNLISTKAEMAWFGIKLIWIKVVGWFREKIIDPLKEKFQKAWDSIKEGFETAWTGMKDFVKGIINTIIDFINGMISAVVGGINAVINALNRISVKIPDWVPVFGGRSWGVNISTVTAPQIPHLATGAVIPAHANMLAMLGEGNQTEIVSPESMLRNIVREELSGMGGQEVTIRFGGDLGALIRELKPYIDKENKRVGTSLVVGGTP